MTKVPQLDLERFHKSIKNNPDRHTQKVGGTVTYLLPTYVTQHGIPEGDYVVLKEFDYGAAFEAAVKPYFDDASVVQTLFVNDLHTAFLQHALAQGLIEWRGSDPAPTLRDLSCLKQPYTHQSTGAGNGQSS